MALIVQKFGGTSVGTPDRIKNVAARALATQAAGNDVIVRAVPAGQHSFIIGAGRVPEVDDAIAEIGIWLRSKLGLAVLQDTAK